jgi:hypothetical protein
MRTSFRIEFLVACSVSLHAMAQGSLHCPIAAAWYTLMQPKRRPMLEAHRLLENAIEHPHALAIPTYDRLTL